MKNWYLFKGNVESKKMFKREMKEWKSFEEIVKKKKSFKGGRS